MKTRNRILLIIASFLIAVLFCFPTLVIYISILLAFIGKYISAIACIVFAWNIAKLVELGYRGLLNEDKSSQHEQVVDDEEEIKWLDGQGYSYYIKDNEIFFQFRNIKDRDGRQLNRLIFMREKYFKDK